MVCHQINQFLLFIFLAIVFTCGYFSSNDGNPFELSPDPLLEELKGMDVKDILKREDIFAVDLFEDSLGQKVLDMYEELCAGPGSVRKVLKKYVDSVLA